MAREAMKKKRMLKTQHIIETATEVFAEKGYHGALTDEIADRAGISKRSMYYYVGDKDTLYEKVLGNLMDEVAAYLRFEENEDESSEENIRRFIRGLAQVAKIQPLHAIILREFFEGGRLPKSTLQAIDRSFENATKLFEKKINGIKNKDTLPILATWIAFAFFVHWEITMPHLSKAGVWAKRMKKAGMDGHIDDKLVEAIENIILHLLKTSD